MSRATYFQQHCPTCGRPVNVRVDYLGKHVACDHCGSEFLSSDRSTVVSKVSDSGEDLLQRADELLSTAPEKRSRPR